MARTKMTEAEKTLAFLQKMPHMSTDELENLLDDTEKEHFHGYAELLLQEKTEEADRKRVAFLLATVAEDMEGRGLNMEVGEGLSRVIITAADLYSAAELLDPDE